MNVTFSNEAKKSDASYTLLRNATRVVEEAIGDSTTDAVWDRAPDDRGSPQYSLRISDGNESADDLFSPDELESKIRMQIRAYRLLGKLLQVRSNKILQRINQSEN